MSKAFCFAAVVFFHPTAEQRSSQVYQMFDPWLNWQKINSYISPTPFLAFTVCQKVQILSQFLSPPLVVFKALWFRNTATHWKSKTWIGDTNYWTKYRLENLPYPFPNFTGRGLKQCGIWRHLTSSRSETKQHLECLKQTWEAIITGLCPLHYIHYTLCLKNSSHL